MKKQSKIQMNDLRPKKDAKGGISHIASGTTKPTGNTTVTGGSKENSSTKGIN